MPPDPFPNRSRTYLIKVALAESGLLGLKPRYKDVKRVAMEPVKEVLSKIRDSCGLERVHSESEALSLQFEMMSKYRVHPSQQFP